MDTLNDTIYLEFSIPAQVPLL